MNLLRHPVASISLVAFAAALTACGGGDDASSAPTRSEAASTAPDTPLATKGALVAVPYRFPGSTAATSVWVREHNGRALFEGDIDLGALQQLQAQAPEDDDRAKALGLRATQVNTWSNNGVVVVDDTALPASYRSGQWRDGLRLLMANTPLRVSRDRGYYTTTVVGGNGIPVTTEDYIQVSWFTGTTSAAGSSQIGRRGGQQPMMLTPNASGPVVAHELMHAMGLWHEQSRSDRDAYVSVNYGNIAAADQHNFDKHVIDGADVGAYDYCSVMHYHSTAFAINPGIPTITPLQSLPCQIYDLNRNVSWFYSIGQYVGLSVGDIGALAMVYPGVTPNRPFADAGPNLALNAMSSVSITLNGTGSFVSGR